MNELIEVIQNHLQKYPLMQKEDVIKLVYQNELGVGHLINSEYALKYIIAEQQEVTEGFSPEYIGNNQYRVSIYKVNPEELLRAMKASTLKNNGTKENLKQKLLYLKGKLSIDNLDEFIDEYISLGMPLMHHSKVYQAAYNPHYRCLDKEFLL